MAGNIKFITVLGRHLKSPIVLASMAGITDVAYVKKRADSIGMAFIGGYNIDEPSLQASKEIEACGRKEFKASITEVKADIESLADTGLIIGVNLRGASKEAYLAAAELLGKNIVYEIDAHCRQKPMTSAGCGEALLSDITQICNIVSTLASRGYTVSVKYRAGIVNDRDLARSLWKAGAEMLHVDLMDFGHSRLRQIRNSCPIVIIANNGVDSPDAMMDYFTHGADLVSLARHAEPKLLAVLDKYIQVTAEANGWYNAPKQLCRGGDYRSLCFCCMPMKQCPLISVLETLNIDREDYVQLKLGAVANTPLAGGKSSCFGSLAFCCKSSVPCMFRDMSLMEAGISKNEYMAQKRHLADIIMTAIFAEGK